MACLKVSPLVETGKALNALFFFTNELVLLVKLSKIMYNDAIALVWKSIYIRQY